MHTPIDRPLARSSEPRRRALPRAILAVSLLAASLRPVAAADRVTPPNVMLISIDCLNQREFETAMAKGWMPALQALSTEALVFDRAYAHAPWTTPSHVSMLTGLYPSQHGRDLPFRFMIAYNQVYDRSPGFRTLPEMLSARGYTTAAFVGKGSISHDYGLSQGFAIFEEAEKDPWSGDQPTTDRRVMEWLRSSLRTPWLLFYHTYDFHDFRPLKHGSIEDTLNEIDRFLGRLFAELKEKGWYSDSLIVVTGDHGSSMVNTEGKCCVHGAGHYEENLRVPLVLKLPGAARTGRSELLVRHVDLLPTVLWAVGVADGTYQGPGAAIPPRLDAPPADDFSVVSYSEADARCAMRHAVVSRRYKYIYTPPGFLQDALRRWDEFYDETCPLACKSLPREELYDLEQDPSETRNLLSGPLSSAERNALEQLRAAATRHLNLPRAYSMRVVASDAQSSEKASFDPKLENALKGLGYLR